MGKSRIWVCGGIMLIIIIIIMCCGMRVATDNKLGWSKRAGVEAERVAAISCSGHGNAYLDGLVVVKEDEDGGGGMPVPVCECHTCYSGSNCSSLLPDCTSIANSGDPLFMEPFWIKNAESSAIIVSGWHRMSYNFPDNSYISQQLVNHIRRLHFVAKNAVTQGRYIVFGAGSTQLLSAAVFALSMDSITSPAKLAAQPPFYPLYKTQTDYFETAHFEFDETALQRNGSNGGGGGEKVIEVVCSPNNPDGNLRKNVLQGPLVSTIYDLAYYWPHYTPIPAPSDEDLMIFTLSKFTGHAGSRFGWALVKDKTTYDNMINFMSEASLGTSRDTQLRVLQLFKTILHTNGTEIFNFAYNTMRRRWDRMNEIISRSNRFTLQKIPPQFCTYYGRVRGPSPPYAWVKCERKEDSNCTKVFEVAKILGNEGKLYHANDSYVRLDLNGRNSDFNLLLQRVIDLVSKKI